MVDLSDYLEADDEADAEPEEAEDLVALRDCLQALADAVASTNLAVLSGHQRDVAASSARVQASVAALQRFHKAFKVLSGDAG